MTFNEILQSVRTLSINEKLALIEATTHMVREAIDLAVNGSSHVPEQPETQERKHVAKLRSTPSLQEVVADLLSRPDPPPETMLQYGMFADQIPDLELEDFKIAEWHPTDEDLDV